MQKLSSYNHQRNAPQYELTHKKLRVKVVSYVLDKVYRWKKKQKWRESNTLLHYSQILNS